MLISILLAAAGCGFTCLMTSLGSAFVFFVKNRDGKDLSKTFLGFASGVMLAASVWSLIIPAIESAKQLQMISWIPVGTGFLAGCVLFYFFDTFMDRAKDLEGRKAQGCLLKAKGSGSRSIRMMIAAITLHNIPEGMAVGLSFSLAAAELNGKLSFADGALISAVALAFGIGIQNFPEGAAVSLPLRSQGYSRGKAFVYGMLSGIVEPIAGILTVLAAGTIESLMPWLLSFAAGVMVFVVINELIPETHGCGKNKAGTIGIMSGFFLMMILDVALG